MPRTPRENTIAAGQFYHVYARGNDGMTIFCDQLDYDDYMAKALELFKKFDVNLHNFALMPNHVHLLLSPQNDTLPEAMRQLQLYAAKSHAKRYDFKGHLWQGRYKSKLIHSESYLVACGNYIEMNPVRAGLVKEPGYWAHSSYNFYASGSQQWDIQTNPLYDSLGKTTADRQSAYKHLISHAMSSSVPKVPGTKVSGTVVGTVV